MKWDQLIQAAVARQILPAEALAMPAPAASHPWPLVLLSFLGAQLAAIPILGFIVVLFGHTLEYGVVAYGLGVLMIAGVCVVLNSGRLPLFVESLALTALMAGMGLLYFKVMHDGPQLGYYVCALIALVTAVLVPVNWVRALLAAVAAGMCYGAVLEHYYSVPAYTVSLVLTLIWLAGLWLQKQLAAEGDWISIALEWMLAGWAMAVLAASITLVEMHTAFGGRLEYQLRGAPLASLLFTLASSSWACKRWSALRSAAGIGLLLVLSGLSWFMPALGPILLIGIFSLLSWRPLQAGAAALAAAWVVGRFYYNLHWLLVSKAQILIVAGLVLALLAWWAQPRTAGSLKMPALPASRATLLLMALGALATLAVVNIGIWQKEDIIAHGQPVFIKLAPVDPRSLMQGDYMALNFEIAPALQEVLRDTSRLERPKVIGNIDDKGVVTLSRLAGNGVPGKQEIMIELSPGARRWVVVSDAWFFKEGDGARWSKARYGEFRVMPDGRALLVGMADEKLLPISP